MSLFADYKKEQENRNVLEWEHGFAIYSFPNENSCYVEDVYIAPEKRSTNYSSLMSEELVRIAKSKSCTKLIGSICTTVGNPHRSLRFLLKHGYTLHSSEGSMIYFWKDI